MSGRESSLSSLPGRTRRDVYIGHVARLTERDSHEERGCGKGTTREISHFLQSLGLHLGMTKDELGGWEPPDEAQERAGP